MQTPAADEAIQAPDAEAGDETAAEETPAEDGETAEEAAE